MQTLQRHLYGIGHWSCPCKFTDATSAYWNVCRTESECLNGESLAVCLVYITWLLNCSSELRLCVRNTQAITLVPLQSILLLLFTMQSPTCMVSLWDGCFSVGSCINRNESSLIPALKSEKSLPVFHPADDWSIQSKYMATDLKVGIRELFLSLKIDKVLWCVRQSSVANWSSPSWLI